MGMWCISLSGLDYLPQGAKIDCEDSSSNGEKVRLGGVTRSKSLPDKAGSVLYDTSPACYQVPGVVQEHGRRDL